MQVVIYVDAVFIINFIVNLFVLCLTGIILHQRIKPWRLFMGALFGAGILFLYMFIPSLLMGAKGAVISTGISMGTMAISFGGMGKGFIKKWFLSTTIMFLLGGIMYFFKNVMGWKILSLYKWFLLFGAGCIVCGMLLHFMKMNGRQAESIYVIRIVKGENTVSEQVYLDTGNMLWDALYQKPVILLSDKTARKCLTKEEQFLVDKIMKEQSFDYDSILNISAQRNNGFHQVRYKSVGRENGWLLCFLADEVWVNEKQCLKRQPIAIAPPFLFRDKEYQGLLHKACI